MTSILRSASPRAVEYPDDDGERRSDNTGQFEWIVTIKVGVEAIYHEDPNVFVADNLLWYPVEGRPEIRNAPDILVAFGRPKGRRGSYKQWEEGGIAPQVIFEVLSPDNRFGEILRKFQFNQRYGVDEYYIYDPDDGSLLGWQRDGNKLQEIPKMAGFRSPRLNIRFEPVEGPNSLVIVGPDGQPFATYVEIVAQRDAEHPHAEVQDQISQAGRQRAKQLTQLARAARQRAEELTQLAQAARQRAEELIQLSHAARQRAEEQALHVARYAARLRERGIEPD